MRGCRLLEGIKKGNLRVGIARRLLLVESKDFKDFLSCSGKYCVLGNATGEASSSLRSISQGAAVERDDTASRKTQRQIWTSGQAIVAHFSAY